MSASVAPDTFGLHAVDLPTVESGRMISLSGRVDYRNASVLRVAGAAMDDVMRRLRDEMVAALQRLRPPLAAAFEAAAPAP